MGVIGDVAVQRMDQEKWDPRMLIGHSKASSLQRLNVATPENFGSQHIERYINNVHPGASAVCKPDSLRINCNL
jgi:hypothetical protein